MANPVRRRKKRLVLDIGSSCIRLCELNRGKSGYIVTKYLQREFNADPALSDDERKENRTKALLTLLKESKVRTKKTVFGVPGQSVFTRSRTLPPVPEFKVSQIVKYEIQQQIPFALDQIAMDYQILDRTTAGGYEVMMAAIKVDVIDRHVDILHTAKRNIDTVDVSPLAAYNWMKKTGAFGAANDCVAMIDMGATTTDIVIEREGQFRFTRPLNVGGNDITKALAAAFGMNFPDAERAKRERGFAPTGDPAKDGKAGEVIGQALQRLVSEIMRSFSYFRSQPGGGQVNRVVLCGGGASLRNIVPYLQRNLGIDVRVVQPLANVQVGPAAQSINDNPEQACVALGLALRCCEAVPIEINLIPPRVLEAMRVKEQAFYWILILLTLGLIFASVIPVKGNENELDRARIEKLKAYISEYDATVANFPAGSQPPQSQKIQEFNTYRDQVNGMSTHITTLDNVRRDRRFWLDELAMVTEARPSGGQIVLAAFESAIISEAPAAPAAPAPGAGGGGYGYGGGGYGDGGGGYGDGGGYGGGGYGGGGYGAAPAGPIMAGMGNAVLNAAGAYVAGFPGIDGITGSSLGGVSLGGSGGFGYDEGYGGEEGYGGGTGGFGGALGGGATANYNARLSVDTLQEVQITPPNGITIMGLASDGGLIREYVAKLEQARRPLPNRQILQVKKVYFAEASVVKVRENALMNAMAAITGAGANPGALRNYRGTSWFSFQINIELERVEPGAVAASSNPEGTPAE